MWFLTDVQYQGGGGSIKGPKNAENVTKEILQTKLFIIKLKMDKWDRTFYC